MNTNQYDFLAEPVSTGRTRSGKARMQGMSPEERKDLAKKAANSRWSGPTPVTSVTDLAAIELGEGAIAIPCCVLEGGIRVLTEKGFLQALGRRGRPRHAIPADGGQTKLPPFLEAENLKPFITAELREAASPIPFQTEYGFRAWGYKAELLPQVCEVYLRASDAKVLTPNQMPIADVCGILVRGLARVGIIALVDEATGYQRDRERDALAKILEAYIAKELQPYVTTFPSAYYENLFRLRNVVYSPSSVKRPQYFGILTNDIVYSRLAPGVLRELKKVIPKGRTGRPKAKLFQALTQNVGYPKLRELLGAVVAVMRMSKTYREFHTKLDQYYPPHGQLALPYDPIEDSGEGL